MSSRLRFLPLAGAFAVAACSSDQIPTGPTPPELNFVAVPVSFNMGAAAEGDIQLVRFRGSSISSKFAAKVASLGGSIVFSHVGAGVAAVSGMSQETATQLTTLTEVEAVDPDTYTTIEDPVLELASADAPDSPTAPQTAAIYGRQWNMWAINAEPAWTAGFLGNPQTRVGILDTGLDYLSPDLFGRVDLALSKSFLDATENARVQAAFPGAHEIADLHYHGTHVGATAVSNGLVGAGVTSQATLVGLKVCFPNAAFNGVCPTSSVLAAILYAADKRIPVINMSLGGTFSRSADLVNGWRESLQLTIAKTMIYARLKSTTVVVSAGNSAINSDTNDPDQYVAYCDAPFVICVSATGPTAGTLSAGRYINIQNIDALAGYSNFGSNVDVAAPGGNVLPIWAVCSGFTLHPALAPCRARFYNPTTGAWSTSIIGLAGTSMAAPHVTGLAALVRGKSKFSTATLTELTLQYFADDLGAANFDPQYGHGRINVWNTVRPPTFAAQD